MEEVERVNESPEFREYISYEEEQRKIRNEYKREGYESGLADGIEQGASHERYSIAKKLLDSGMKVEEISRITEIPETKIREIYDTM